MADEDDVDREESRKGQRTQRVADETSAPLVFRPFDTKGIVHRTGRRLPHWYQEGCTYFATFRLADSVPQEKLRQWQEERERWLSHRPTPLSERDQAEYDRRFGDRLQAYLDAGYGACYLAEHGNAAIVRDSLHHSDGSRYDLGPYVIMPNHGHVLVTPISPCELPEIMQAWKGFTAKMINRRVARTGTLWLDESFDHIVRTGNELMYYADYIRGNPGKARLQPGSFIVGCGMFEIGKSGGLCSGSGADVPVCPE